MYLGGDDDLVAGLSLVSVSCGETLFLDGLAVNQIWFQVRSSIFFFLFFLLIDFFIR